MIFTGATAGVKAFPQSATFAAGNFAKRALSQSLAKEFGPKGVHVSYALIDGVIDIPKMKGYYSDTPDAKISPDAVSDQFYFLRSKMRWVLTSAVLGRLRTRIGISIHSQRQRLRGRLISGLLLRSGEDHQFVVISHDGCRLISRGGREGEGLFVGCSGRRDIGWNSIKAQAIYHINISHTIRVFVSQLQQVFASSEF